MRTRLLFWDEDEVQKKKTLVLVFAILLILSLLGLYAVTSPGGELIAGATPTVLPSPSVVTPTTPLVSTPMATATPTASVTPVPPEPTVVPPATSVAHEPTLTLTVASPIPTLMVTVGTTSVAETPAVPPPTLSPVSPEPTSAPTIVPTAPLAAPVITTPPDGSILKDDRPPIAGTAPPNTTVQVYDDGSLIRTAAADAQGAWALVPDEPLEPGEHTITAVASDDAGRTSDPSAAVTFTVITERLPTAGGSWFERWLDRLLFIAFP